VRIGVIVAGCASCGPAYREGVETTERTCELCGDPIDPDQATMVADGATAHSGCVYRDADEADRDRWMPPDTEA